MKTIEVDAGGCAIGVFDRLLKRGATVGHSEDAAAGGDQAGGTEPCSRMEDLAGGVFDAGDGVACPDLSGVAVRGEDDANAGFGAPGGLGAVHQGGQEIGVHAVEKGLRFGVAEPDVVLKYFRAGFGEHETGVQEAAVRHAVGGHAAYGGFDDGIHDELRLRGRKDSPVAVGSHASRVGSFVIVEDRLMVLRGFERDGAAVLDVGDEADFFAREEFLDQEGRLGKLTQGGARVLVGVGDDDALAGGEAVRFQDHGRGAGG